MSYLETRAILTNRVFKVINEDYVSQFFDKLWEAVYALSVNFIQKNIPNKNTNVWDIVRFAVKGGTSILKSLDYIKTIGEDKDNIIENIKKGWSKTDWDTGFVINPDLPDNLYWDLYYQIFTVIIRVKNEYSVAMNEYIHKNIQKYIFDVTDEPDIQKYNRLKTAVIEKITAYPDINQSDIYRDYINNEIFESKAHLSTANQHVMKLLLQYYSSKPAASCKQQIKNKKGMYNYGFTQVVCKSPSNGYVGEQFIRDLKFDFATSRQDIFAQNFDLYRILINYNLEYKVKINGKPHVLNYPSSSELIDITFQISHAKKKFEKLKLNKILPVYSLPYEEYKAFKHKIKYPINNLDYNINDNIRVVNEGGSKIPKRCRRIGLMMKARCLSEREIQFNEFKVDSCGFTASINENVCNRLGTNWGECIVDGKKHSKKELIQLIMTEFGSDEKFLWKFKKQYLCHIVNTFNRWIKIYPEIRGLLKKLGLNILTILNTELEIHPRIINPYITLPYNLLDVLYLKNIIIDLEYRNFVSSVRSILDKPILLVLNQVQAKNTDVPFFVVGGMAYTLIYEYIKKLPDIQPYIRQIPIPQPSVDYDIVWQIATDKSIRERLAAELIPIFEQLTIPQDIVNRINATNPRFKIVDPATHTDFNENFSWKYLTNVHNNEKLYKVTPNKYLFITVQNRPDVFIIRVDILIYDMKYSMYRIDHLVEFGIGERKIYKQGAHYIPIDFNGLYINVASPSVLFKFNLTSIKSRKKDGDLKWTLDQTRLKFLCALNQVYIEIGKPHFLTNEDAEKCNVIIKLDSEVSQAWAKQEQMAKLILPHLKQKNR